MGCLCVGGRYWDTRVLWHECAVARGQLLGISFLFPVCGSHSDCPARQQEPLKFLVYGAFVVVKIVKLI